MEIEHPPLPILEGIMTTVTPGDAPVTDRVNIAPMGPRVDLDFTRFQLRPFHTSTTYRNLRATGEGVFHVTDDVLLLARAAIGRVTPGQQLPVVPAKKVQGVVLTGACRYYELVTERVDDTPPRATFTMRVVRVERLRDFFGFNRARHAVLEAAILATRLHLTGRDPVLAQFASLQTIVDKTGSPPEHQAMAELRRYVTAWTDR